MPEGSKIVLCGPEPGWLYTDRTLTSLEALDFAVGIATSVRRHHRVPILLSGDTHHYGRYCAAATETHFITSGGGGAFLHPTHNLRDTNQIRWLNKLVTAVATHRTGKQSRPNRPTDLLSNSRRNQAPSKRRHLVWCKKCRVLIAFEDCLLDFCNGTGRSTPSRCLHNRTFSSCFRDGGIFWLSGRLQTAKSLALGGSLCDGPLWCDHCVEPMCSHRLRMTGKVEPLQIFGRA